MDIRGPYFDYCFELIDPAAAVESLQNLILVCATQAQMHGLKHLPPMVVLHVAILAFADENWQGRQPMEVGMPCFQDPGMQVHHANHDIEAAVHSLRS